MHKAAGSFQKLMARLDNIDERAAAYKVKLIARGMKPEPELTKHLSTKDREWKEWGVRYGIACGLYIEVLDLVILNH